MSKMTIPYFPSDINTVKEVNRLVLEETLRRLPSAGALETPGLMNQRAELFEELYDRVQAALAAKLPSEITFVTKITFTEHNVELKVLEVTK